MKNLYRVLVASLAIMSLASLVRAQERPYRAEFECLLMTGTRGVAAPGEKAPVLTYHQVWIPNMRYGTFESNGVQMVYDMEGSGNETIVVVHGGPGLPHEYFHPLLSNLGRYARLVYFDRRADLLSPRSTHEIVSIDEMADDLDALRRALGLSRVTLLAHSFGGSIALNYALRYPAHVKRLILVSAAARIEDPGEAEHRLLKVLTAEQLSAYRSGEGTTGNTACDRVRRRYRALFPHYFHLTPNSRWLDLGVYSAYFDSLAKRHVLASSSGRFDLRAQLGRIKVPSLVLGGRYDLVTPLDQVEELAKAIPSARMVVMEHSAHFPFIEENFMFTEWVRRFLASTADLGDDSALSAPVVTQTGGGQ
ncbi:MAG TPA: alpha/beta fold hydrolase [Blastocatellia bacterium]|nr:alpha/beta fold hydrolase [Blastocatellia bacterium]